MFTGIIQKTGEVTGLDRSGGSGVIRIEAGDWDTPLEIGESIAVNGACLTLADHDGDELRFDVLEETFSRTTLGTKTAGPPVNLERSLRVGDSLGGHIVSGHIDGIGTVKSIDLVDRDRMITIACGPDIMDGIVMKGSVAIDGISLTVAAFDERSFQVHIIPHTWDVTSLRALQVGDELNLECDMLGRYVKRYLAEGKLPDAVTWEGLRACGFLKGIE